jgi:hypothetical protein
VTVSVTTNFDRDRFMKLIAHLDSDNDNEMLTAARHARAMLQKHGLRFSELPKLFPSATTSSFDFDVDDDFMRQAEAKAQREAAERQRRDEEERARRREEERKRAEAAERAREELRRQLEPQRQAIIARYGSERAAYASRGLERSIETAWELARKELQIARRPWVDRSSEAIPEETIPEEVITAIRRPGPFPATIAVAAAELNYWSEREDELAILDYCEAGSREFLSRACRERRRMVEKAFQTGLRATSIQEVIIRQRAHIEGDFNDTTGENAEAILADLEALAQTEAPSEAVQFTHPTAMDRRNEIIQILTSPEGHGLSDRDIAKLFGVANSTVSRIHRRLAAQKTAGRKRKS